MEQESKKNLFESLLTKDITKHLEKKGQFDYLPWADAWEQMKKVDPDAKVNIHKFKHYKAIEGHLVHEELPYYEMIGGAMVEVSVTLHGKTETETLPVLNYSNKPVSNPSSTEVNKATKRCFVKALALHGLGLYVYRGEDLPEPIIIGNKEIEMLEKITNSLVEKTSGDYEKIVDYISKKVNEETAQRKLNAYEVLKFQEYSTEQYGIALREINKLDQQADEKLSKEKKTSAKTEKK